MISLSRGALTVVLALGFWSGSLQAQQAPYQQMPIQQMPIQQAPYQQMPLDQGVPAQGDCESCAQGGQEGGEQRTGLLGRIHQRRATQQVGVGCWSHHNAFLCGTFRSEMRFIFGSCRAFYGQPCLKGSPGFEDGGAYTRQQANKAAAHADKGGLFRRPFGCASCP